MLLSQFLFVSQVFAVVLPPTEEELAELASLGVTGEVVESECVSSSYNADLGMTTNVYSASVAVEEVLVGDHSEPQVDVFYKSNAYDQPPESCADFGDDPMHGTSGNYYLTALDDGNFEILGQFIENTNDVAPPECSEVDSEPSSEPASEPSEETEPSSETGDTGVDVDKGGCSSTGSREFSVGILLSLCLLCVRRQH